MSLPHPSITETINTKDISNLAAILNELPPFEIADLLANKILKEETAMIIDALSPKTAGATYKYLSRKLQKQILHIYPMPKIVAMLKEMETDDSIALLKDLPKKDLYKFIQQLPYETQVEISEQLGYPKKSVGRLMTTNFISAKKEWTVGQLIEHIRLSEDAWVGDIYITDEEVRLYNVLEIKQLFSLSKDMVLEQLPRHELVTLSLLELQENAVRVFIKHGFFALPVVDNKQILHGVVTMDDILRLASRLNTSKIQKIGGTDALDESYTDTPFLQLIKKRGKWLVLLFLGEMFTATAMGFFEEEISKAVVLALFLPLIISSGGNAGSQSSTLIIRAMALGEVKLKDWFKTMRWEILSGFLLGCLLGLVGFARVTIWSSVSTIYGVHHLLIALTIFIALIGVVTWGSLMGAMLPFILRRVGVDPATSSAPLVATLVDVTGIVIYFHVAMWVLKGVLL